jgi:hypothetical protein
MKTSKFCWFLAILAICSTSRGIADSWEFGMKVMSGSNMAQREVVLYHWGDMSVALRRYTTVVNADTFGVNFQCDIDDRPLFSEPNTAIPPASIRMIPPGEYALMVGNQYIHLSIPPYSFGKRDFELRYNDAGGVGFSYFSGTRGILIPPIMTYSPTTSTYITLDQKGIDNTTTGDLFHVFADGSEITTNATAESIPVQYPSNQTLRADRTIVNSQKYNNWNGLADVTNFHQFQINTTNLSFTSRLTSIDASATISTQLLDLLSAKSDNVQFADPWLVDFSDMQYGGALRNQGSGAPLKTRSTPFHPDLSTSYGGDIYGGVFLNQPIVVGKPYYTIGALNPATIQGGDAYFINWVSNGSAVVQNNNSAVTGIVFTGPNAIATGIYKGHMRTGAPSFADAHNQRRLVREASAVPS